MLTGMARYLFCILVIFVGFLDPAAAMDDVYGSVLTLKARKYWSTHTFSEFTVHSRFLNFENNFERLILEASIAREHQNFEFSGGYQLHTFRQGIEGQEHRLWQQVRYRKFLEKSYIDFYTRQEERYFGEPGEVALRNRSAVIWFKNLSDTVRIGLGDEVDFNLNSTSASIQSGYNQNRLMAGVRYRYSNAGSIDLNYQLRFVNDTVKENYRFHQVQVVLLHRF